MSSIRERTTATVVFASHQTGTTRVIATGCGGLAVHRQLDMAGKICRRGKFVITHCKSGRKLPGFFETRQQALTALEKLLPITDWRKAAKWCANKSTEGAVLRAMMEGRDE